MVSQQRHLLIFAKSANNINFISELAGFTWQIHIADDVNAALKLAQNIEFYVGFCQLDVNDKLLSIKQIQQLITAFEKVNRSMRWLLGLVKVSANEVAINDTLNQLITQYCDGYIRLPINPEKIHVLLEQAYDLGVLTAQQANRLVDFQGKYGIIGRSPQMQRVFSSIAKITNENSPLLIEGETGTGKEMIAQGVHRHSTRANQPFIAINCGAIPKDLIQAELFGHEKGAFTGAHQRHIGRIESAQGGTLFLDEIGDLPIDQQANLLRFMEEKTIVRVGGSENVSIDARIISATHINLKQAVTNGLFREDLYYRLRVLHIQSPPLRERDNDIELLAWHFFYQFARKNYKPQGFSQDALNLLKQYDWPGNIRELMNCIHNAIVMSENRFIRPADLALERRRNHRTLKNLAAARADADREIILTCLRHSAFNISETAEILDISRASLYRLIEKYQINLAAPK